MADGLLAIISMSLELGHEIWSGERDCRRLCNMPWNII